MGAEKRAAGQTVMENGTLTPGTMGRKFLYHDCSLLHTNLTSHDRWIAKPRGTEHSPHCCSFEAGNSVLDSKDGIRKFGGRIPCSKKLA